MFRGIDLCIWLELFYVFVQMGYGDDLVIVDWNFLVVVLVWYLFCKQVLQIGVRLQGVVQLVISFMLLDMFVFVVVMMMQVVDNFELVFEFVVEIILLIEKVGFDL